MATKLKNLKVKKVDFVDEGANPDAHIELFKRKDGKPEEDPNDFIGGPTLRWCICFGWNRINLHKESQET